MGGGIQVRTSRPAWTVGRAGLDADAVADLDQTVVDPAAAATLLPGYDGGDRLHSNDTAAEARADTVRRAIVA